MKKKLQYKKVGRLTKNARYTIKYDKDGKADVRWSYVRRGSDSRRGYYLPLAISLIVTLLLLYDASRFLDSYTPFVILKDCNATLVHANFTVKHENVSGVSYINMTCLTSQNKTIPWKVKYYATGDYVGWRDTYPKGNLTVWKSLKYSYTEKRSLPIFLIRCSLGIFAAFFYFILAFLLHKVIKFKKPKWKPMKKIDSWMSERNAKMTKADYRCIFRKVPENNILEIPVFYNNFLHYTTKGEFNEYLTKIEVKEHPFQQFNKKASKQWSPNEYLFSCKFYFSQNPKKGSLEVRWR